MNTNIFTRLIGLYMQTMHVHQRKMQPSNHSNALYSPHYAMDNREQSNFSYRDAESALLERLNLPAQVQRLDLAEAIVLMNFLSRSHRLDHTLAYDNKTLEAVAIHGYHWRTIPELRGVNPETALYLDSYVRAKELAKRLDELYQEYQERVIKQKQELDQLQRRIAEA